MSLRINILPLHPAEEGLFSIIEYLFLSVQHQYDLSNDLLKTILRTMDRSSVHG